MAVAKHKNKRKDTIKIPNEVYQSNLFMILVWA